MPTKTQADKANDFRGLHEGPRILVLANVWDVVTARIVESLGFPAVATSSAAVAQSLGYPNGERIGRREMLQAVGRIARSVRVPVSADLEAGYGPGPKDMIETTQGLIEAGAVGLNLEDGTNDPVRPLVDIALHVEKIHAIRGAAQSAGVPVVINARTDVFLEKVGPPEACFDTAVERLSAYRRAGADCLFAPGVEDREMIGRLVQAVDGPLNILAGPATPAIRELEELGVRRVSFGSWPMRAAMGWFRHFASELLKQGAFTTLAPWAIPYAELNRLVAREEAGAAPG